MDVNVKPTANEAPSPSCDSSKGGVEIGTTDSSIMYVSNHGSPTHMLYNNGQHLLTRKKAATGNISPQRLGLLN